ncbi:MAG: HAD family phosphatase [Solirubrobacteraceae bacterium]|nr:HAD family phosphatase [Solirubrobacteraceae bacterium]
MPATALLVDFGGVLTTSVFDAFGRFCVGHGLVETRFADLLREERSAADLLVAVEKGELPVAEFERRFAPLLGPDVPAEGLVRGLTAALEPDAAMVEAVAALRASGVRTALVSNSMGDDPYAGLELDRLFDHVVLSERVGMRKPSRAIYRHALALVDVDPQDAVLVDDLEQNCAAARRLGMGAVHHTDARSTIDALQRAFGPFAAPTVRG